MNEQPYKPEETYGSGLQIWEIPDLIDRLSTSPGSAWRFQLDTLLSLFDHERSKFPFVDGGEYMIAKTNNWNQPGLALNRAVTLRSINWNSYNKNWSAMVQPHREWWWSSMDNEWTEYEKDRIHLYHIHPGTLAEIPHDWIDPGGPVGPGPVRGSTR